MIKYKFDNIECQLDFDKLIKITYNNITLYKKDFSDFSDFCYFLDIKNNQITHILFDGYEYYLKNGKLHNLYGPARIKYYSDEEIKNSYFLTNNVISWFYINGKLVCDNLDNRGCRKIEDFQNNNIFHWRYLKHVTTNRKRRLKEGIDYIKYPINLNLLILIDQRKKKLQKIDLKSKINESTNF